MAEDNVKHIHIEDADEAEEQKTESPEAEEAAAAEEAEAAEESGAEETAEAGEDKAAEEEKNALKADFEAYLDGFSPNVQEILDKFKFRNFRSFVSFCRLQQDLEHGRTDSEVPEIFLNCNAKHGSVGGFTAV